MILSGILISIDGMCNGGSVVCSEDVQFCFVCVSVLLTLWFEKVGKSVCIWLLCFAT